MRGHGPRRPSRRANAWAAWLPKTGYGFPAHKKLKNELASKVLWESIQGVRTVGVVRHDAGEKNLRNRGRWGVVAALTPSTNPTIDGDVQGTHFIEGAATPS